MDERLARTGAALREVGADWAVLSGADSIAYALGYAPQLEAGPSPFAACAPIAIVGRDGAAGVLALESEIAAPREGVVARYDGYGPTHAHPASAAYTQALHGLLRQLGVGGPIAVEPATHPEMVEAHLPVGERVDLTPALRRQRMTKTPAEITALRRAAEVAAAGQGRLLGSLRPGITELALFCDIRGAMEAAAGARIAVAGDLVSGRARTAAIGGWPCGRVIEVGDAVLSDLGPRVAGYWADSCATVVLGPPTEDQMRLYIAARRALAFAVVTLRPGITAATAHRAVRRVVQQAGFDYPHHTGHGIGTAVHEHPRLCEAEDAMLRPGMVLMVEPGAYDPEIGGARTEWMLLLTETGCVPLASFPLVASVPG
jgi:Xaa-Pro aminopeptidase